MKSFAFALLLAVCVTALPKSADRRHVGSQVFRVVPHSPSQVKYLQGIQRSDKYDFWTQPSVPGKPVDIMASRWMVPVLKQTVESARMMYSIMIPDLYKTIVESRREQEVASQKEGRAMDWATYHEYDEIMDWVDSLATTYPSLVSVEDVGQSYEGRTMKIVKVSTGGSGKPAIFSDAGIHAREWIAPATLTYIMNELLSNSAAYSDVLDAVDFYFMPSINPDGYAYSWSDDRMWRKTRSPTDSGLGCMGADPNRNWDFHWMESGASSSACSDIYAGPVAFSEVETQIVRDQMLQYSDLTQVYLTFHSYSQVWLYPWGYDSTLPDDWEDLDALANDAVDALTAVHGTEYGVGGSGSLLYPAAGASDDYAKGVGNIKYAYTIELRDTGSNGFILPEDQIIPTGEETFAAFQVVMNFVRDTYGTK